MISSRILECHYEANTPSRCNLTRLSRLYEGRVCFCLYFWDGLAHTPRNTHDGTELLRPTNPSGVSRLLDSICCSVWGLSLPHTQPRQMHAQRRLPASLSSPLLTHRHPGFLCGHLACDWRRDFSDVTILWGRTLVLVMETVCQLFPHCCLP